jgi:uncharacterized glyoxalase superfamily protein PhnB
MEQGRTIADSEGVSLKAKKKPGPSNARTDFLIINQPKERTMRINAYLNFNGQCEAAFKFYERCLGGKIEAMIPHAGTPAEEHVTPEWRKKILHARLIVGDDVLMGSDAPPDRYEAPSSIENHMEENHASKRSTRSSLDKEALGRNHHQRPAGAVPAF